LEPYLLGRTPGTKPHPFTLRLFKGDYPGVDREGVNYRVLNSFPDPLRDRLLPE